MLVRRRHVQIEIEQKTIRISTADLVHGQDQTPSPPPHAAVTPKPLPRPAPKPPSSLQVSPQD